LLFVPSLATPPWTLVDRDGSDSAVLPALEAVLDEDEREEQHSQ